MNSLLAEPSLATESWIQPSNEYMGLEPFPHLIADDFFSPEVYAGLCFEFNVRLAHGLEESPKLFRFERNHARAPDGEKPYDLYVLGLPRNVHWPLSIFYSRPFFDYIQRRFEIPLSPDLTGGFHHHAIGSETGFVHNDFVTCNFLRDPLPNGLNPASGDVKTFGPKVDQPGVAHSCRAIAVIYYMNNPTWNPGDGGETALYDVTAKSVQKIVAPLNNRLLAFSIGPGSYHNFLSNLHRPRNSAVIWLHAPPEYMVEKYGKAPNYFSNSD